MNRRIYRIDIIPDVRLVRHCLSANGDPYEAISRAMEAIRGFVAASPPGSVHVQLRYVAIPGQMVKDPQSRVSFYIVVSSTIRERFWSLTRLIERGPLSLFFKIKKEDHCEAPWDILSSACHVVRSQAIVPSLYSRGYNPNIPEQGYYTIKPFKARQRSDFISQDCTLDSLDNEPAVITVSVESADASRELKAFGAYYDLLAQAAHPPYLSDETVPGPVFKGEAHTDRYSDPSVRPPRYQADPLAGDLLYSQREILRSLAEVNLSFNISVLSPSVETAEMLAVVFAEAYFESNSYALKSFCNGHPAVQETIRACQTNTLTLVPALECLFGENVPTIYHGCERLSSLATPEELSASLIPPIGPRAALRTMHKDSDVPRIEGDQGIIVGRDADIDSRVLDDTGTQRPSVLRGIRLRDLAMHVLIAAANGGGKTTMLFHLLIECVTKGIPVVVVEASKTEFRALLTLMNSSDPDLRELASRIRIYTPGSNVSPFRNSPLVMDEEISLDRRIGRLTRCLQACVPLEGPMYPLLAEALYRLFEDREGSPRILTLLDLLDTVTKVIREKGYDNEATSDLIAAFDTRLSSMNIGILGEIFRTAANVPDYAEMVRPGGITIIELDAVARMMAPGVFFSLAGGLKDYLSPLPYILDMPKAFLFIEEAGAILSDNCAAAPSSDHPDSRSFASDLLNTMLTECRAIGLGIVISEHNPTRMPPDTVNQPASVICLRQRGPAERDLLADAMLLNEDEAEDLVRLKPGEAYFTTCGYPYPCRIIIPNIKERLGLGIPPSDTELRALIQDTLWFREAAERRLLAEMEVLLARREVFEVLLDSIDREAKRLSDQLDMLKRTKGASTARALSSVSQCATALSQDLNKAYQRFVRHFHRPLTRTDMPPCIGADLVEQRRAFEAYFETSLKPTVERLQSLLNNIVRCCD